MRILAIIRDSRIELRTGRRLSEAVFPRAFPLKLFPLDFGNQVRDFLVWMSSVNSGRRLTLEKIIKIRDKREACPHCLKPMRYRRVSGTMKLWAPAPYAWTCPQCRFTQLDGSIVPGEETWDVRMEKDEKRRLSSFLAAAIRGSKKT